VLALEKNATTNPAAHAFYLKGRFHHYQFTEADEKLAIDCFKQALALDPDYAMAHAGMAAVYAELSSSFLSPAEAMPIAKSYVTKALALDDSLAEAHHSLALVRWWGDWDFAGAETEFKRSLELNPNDATTHAEYAGFLSQRGRFAEAHAAADRSLAIDPQSDVDRASIFINQRRYEEAAAEVRQQLARQSSSDPTQLRYLLANVYVLQGKLREAVSEARLARAASAKPGASDAFLAIVLASAGEKAEARAMVDSILRLAQERYISPVRIARIYAALGEADHAFEWLQTAYDTRSDHLLHLNISPYYDNLRADPRFQVLLKKIGLVK
jgi:Tfp pilus assembly protein PilF